MHSAVLSCPRGAKRLTPHLHHPSFWRTAAAISLMPHQCQPHLYVAMTVYFTLMLLLGLINPIANPVYLLSSAVAPQSYLNYEHDTLLSIFAFMRHRSGRRVCLNGCMDVLFMYL